MKLTAVAQDFSAIAQSAADHIVQAIANEGKWPRLTLHARTSPAVRSRTCLFP